MNTEAIEKGVVWKNLPIAVPDGDEKPFRLSRYRDQMVVTPVPTRHLLADEGSYFVATTPTPGTGIAEFSVSTSFSDTRAFFIFQNVDTPGPGGKRIYLDYIKLIYTTTAAATVSLNFAFKRSQGKRDSLTAANRNVNTPVPLASAGGRQSICNLLSYNATAAFNPVASNLSDPVVCRVTIPTGLGILNDEYILKFGGESWQSKPGLTAARATDPGRVVAQCPPLMVEPGESLVCHRWWLTEGGVTGYEWEVGWFER